MVLFLLVVAVVLLVLLLLGAAHLGKRRPQLGLFGRNLRRRRHGDDARCEEKLE